MNDEIFDRMYQAGRPALNAGIDRIVSRIGRSLGEAFDAAHRVQFDAPWSTRSRGPGCA